MDRMKVLVMFTNYVDIKDETGRSLTGVSCEYYFWGQNGEMLESKVSADGLSSGIRRSKVFLDANTKFKINCVPGIYDGKFEMSVGGDGKPMLKLVDLDFISKVSMMEDN